MSAREWIVEIHPERERVSRYDRTVTTVEPATILIAPDSFKGCLDADAVAVAIKRGWRRIRSADDVRLIPQADGGEGTLAAIERAHPDAVRRPAGMVTGPDGTPVSASWLELADSTAVVELAETSGLALMRRLDPLGATSRGLGEVIAAAIDAGAERLVVALGGSASTDAGLPALEAIGSRPPPPGGAVLLTDVTAPLLGPNGAASVFGPQKGATTPDLVSALEERLADAAHRLGGNVEEPGAGAAGGTAFGLARWGARIVPGAAEVAALSGLISAAPRAQLIVTGEGRFDTQSRMGKVVGGILGLARPVALIAGQIAAEFPGPAVALATLAGSTDAAIADPGRWLTEAGSRIATDFCPQDRKDPH